MTEIKKRHYIYVNINKQTVALFLIANVLRISKYKLFLLYETFANDVFLFFNMFQDTGYFKELTGFRLNRCFQHAETLTPVLLGAENHYLSITEQKTYKLLNEALFENKLRIEIDCEVA